MYDDTDIYASSDDPDVHDDYADTTEFDDAIELPDFQVESDSSSLPVSFFEPPAYDSDPPDPNKLPTGPMASTPWRKWLLVAGIASAALVGISILVVIIPILINLSVHDTNTPDRAAQAFYEALNNKNYVGAQKYVDPEAVMLPNALSLAEVIRAKVAELAKQALGADIDIQVIFQDLTYEITQQDVDQAAVHVRGRVRIYDARSNAGVTLPYDTTHQMIRRQRVWYMKAG